MTNKIAEDLSRVEAELGNLREVLAILERREAELLEERDRLQRKEAA